MPWPQKGPSVSLPLHGDAPVISEPFGTGIPTFNFSGSEGYNLEGGADKTAFFSTSGGNGVAASWNDTQLVADNAAVTASTINEIREAFQIQRMFEKDARGGSRYTESCRIHFGVISPDARLQRPEYLGGGSSPINVTAVPAMYGDVTTPLGELAGYGTVTGSSGHGFSKSFVEHGVIIGFVSARADLNYQEGLHKQWTRQTRWDFYWPSFAHLGEEAILNQELVCVGTSVDTEVFGYQERYSSYRYKPSLVTSLLRSNATGPLDSWHLAQRFITTPALDADFIVEDPPIDRVIAVPTQPHFILDCFFKYRCARPMPVYGVPGNMDRF